MPERKKISFEEFLKIDNNKDEPMEFINCEIYLQASPRTIHQRISRKISTVFDIYFRGKECEPFSAPFDVILSNEKEISKNKVIPDISVICDKTGLNDENYTGIPTLIVEILSPSNEAHDLVTKMNLYQHFGVNEYWIVNPKIKTVSIYKINERCLYEQFGVYKNGEEFETATFKGLRIDLKEIF